VDLNPIIFNASGVATTTLSYPSAPNATAVNVSLSGVSIAAKNLPQCCPNGANCTVANSCSSTFNTAGFLISASSNGTQATIPAQTAGNSSSTYYLRAVQTSTTTGACTSALTGANSINWAYQCNNPTTCSSSNLLAINGGTSTTVQRNPNSGVSSYLPVAMTFDAQGNAPFTFNYSDVGQITLWATTTVNSATLSGSSNTFVVKPASFTVTGIKQTASPQLLNPAASDATGTRFVKAGEAFTATVSAVTSNGTVTPNFGQETTPEGVTLAQTLVAPTGGAAGALSNGSIGGGSFGGTGSATVTSLAWSEVGIISLTASLADGDYLGAGAVAGTSSGNVGRFYPDRFAITQGATTPACSNVFSYFGQDGFTTAFTLTAQNSSAGTTQNYTSSFAKLGLTGWGNFNFTASGMPTGSVLAASATSPTGTWGSGTATVTARHQISHPTSLTGLLANTSIVVLAAPLDSDGVTVSATQVAAATPLRLGRLRLQNAYGSELLALPVPAWTEYRSTAGAYVKNTDDSCTSIPVPVTGSGLVFGSGNLTAGETVASLRGVLSGTVTWLAGDGSLVMSRPGPGNSGYVDITLTVSDWLKFPWQGGANISPTARATFGIYKSPLIFRRENF